MFSPDLLKNCSITKAIGYTASGTTALTGTVDMQGYDGVIFVAEFVTANAGNFLKASHGDAADGSDKVDLEGSKVLPLVSGNLAILDVVLPAKGATVGPRYVTVSTIRAGAATILGSCIAIRYNAHKKPVNNTVANASDSKTVISPPEGTA